MELLLETCIEASPYSWSDGRLSFKVKDGSRALGLPVDEVY